MKKTVLMLLALAMLWTCCACALAEGTQTDVQKGPAATRVTTQLLSTPQPGAKVLMNYYPGVRVEVVRRSDAEYVQVNVGNRPGTLTGYMRAEDLAFTEAGVRGVQGVEVRYEAEDRPRVYSYMDELSQDMGLMWQHYNVLGVSDEGWLHVTFGNGNPSDATGFAYRGSDASEMSIRLAPYVYTLPMQGELTFEEAAAFAKEQMLRDNVEETMGHPVTGEGLDACTVSAYALIYPDGTFFYEIAFIDADGNFYAHMDITVEGTDVVRYGYGNG